MYFFPVGDPHNPGYILAPFQSPSMSSLLAFEGWVIWILGLAALGFERAQFRF